MANRNGTQLGYFIDFALWQDALNLLRFQIEQKQSNRHFNTLSMFYYEKLNVSCLNYDSRHYFDVKIATSLFYGLKKEFAVLPYVIPKPGLGLRDCKFLTYPMRAVYYAVGLYLLKLSQEFVVETYKKIKTIESFYGGNITYKSDELQLNKKNIYYRNFHQEFRDLVKEETKSDTENKIVLKLDIENYFNELSILKLLNFLDRFIKPSIKAEMRFDTFAREQIICLFQFISYGKSGIPQSDNDILSSFIGYLYLIFGDLFIDDILVGYKNAIDSHHIIRYNDDIYISITFKYNLEPQSQSFYIHSIAAQIAEVLYSELGLKLNLKTKLYKLSQEEDKNELLKIIRKTSQSNDFIVLERENDENDHQHETSVQSPQEKLDLIFAELIKIKNSKPEDYFVRGDSTQEEIIQEVFDKGVANILDKPENKNKIRQIFEEFNFELVKVQPLEILIILLKDDVIANRFIKFCLNKDIITTGDADLIIKFLCQTGFKDDDLDLIEKLKQNIHMKDIVDIFLENKLNCRTPGYYNLSCIEMKSLSEMPDVIEQTRLRILNERSESFSVALNHLVNEIHAVCIRQKQADKTKFDVNGVVKFLQEKNVAHSIRIKVRNLFDRRNSNCVSHPGSNGGHAWDVTKEEYLDYYEHVGKCLDSLL
ncbi:MAG: AbiA family abortive infection protein [Cyanobacteria bacterium J06648_1]